MSPILSLFRLPHAEGLALPEYASAQAAGFDLIAALGEEAPMLLKPRQRGLIPTGLIMDIPKGYEGQVRPRSGLALKHGVTVLNSPGTIDSDYRGEVKIILVNLGEEDFIITRGMRIAQMVIAPHAQVRMQAVLSQEEFSEETARGAGGFGSTGVG